MLIFVALGHKLILAVEDEVTYLIENLSGLEAKVVSSESLTVPREHAALSKGFRQCCELLQQLVTLEQQIDRCSVILQEEEANLEMFRWTAEDLTEDVEAVKEDKSQKHFPKWSVMRTQIEAQERAYHYGRKLLAYAAWKCLDEAYGFVLSNLKSLANSVENGYLKLLHFIDTGTQVDFTAELPTLASNCFMNGESFNFYLSTDCDDAREIFEQKIWQTVSVTKPSVFYNQVNYLTGINPLFVWFAYSVSTSAKYEARLNGSEMTFPKFHSHDEFRGMICDLFFIANFLGHDLLLVNLVNVCDPKLLPLDVITETFKFFQEAFSMDPSIYSYSVTKVIVKLSPAYQNEYKKITEAR